MVPHMVAHVLLFLVFLAIYMSVDFPTHFVSTQPVEAPLTVASPLYFTVATHTLLGDNSAVPRTTEAKCVVAAHAAFAWCITLAALGTVVGDSL